MQSNGYYTLKNNDLVLRATGAVSGVSVKVQALSSTDPRQYWKIIRNWNGSYQLMNYSGESSNLCLSGGSSTNGTNTSLAVHTVDHNAADDWTLVPTEKGDASFFCVSDSFSEMTPTYNSIANMISFSQNLGYNATRRIVDKEGYTVEKGLAYMASDSIWYCISHGGKSLIAFPSDLVTINQSHMDLNTTSENSLCKCQLLIYQGCSVGANTDGDGANLSGLTYKRGVHHVISHPQSIRSPQSCIWSQALFVGLSVGYTLGEAKEYADDNQYDQTATEYAYGNLTFRHDLGDDSLRLDLPAYPAVSTNAVSETATLSLEDASLSAFVNEKNILLTKNESLYSVVEASTASDTGAYNVYKDASNNVYITQSNTDILETYIPNTEGLILGDTIVDSQVALQQAETFLASAGYDVTGFTMTHSNEFSKKFKVTYQYRIGDVDTTEKLTLAFKAEEDGTVHLTRFAVYNYGAFSSTDAPAISAEDYAALLPSLELTVTIKAAGSSYTMSDPIWYRNDSGNVQLRASVVMRDENGENSFEEAYSTLLQ